MSTKFSIRPAPRKRPWICKRSPPCLPTPSYPPSLIATFSLIYRPPIGLPSSAYGSLLLEWKPLGNRYQGTWTSGLDWYDLDFFRNFVTDEVYAIGSWAVNGNHNWGQYPYQTSPPAPMPVYYAATLTPPRPAWLARLLVTG